MTKINARTKGHDFERKFAEYLRIYGYEAVTSRSENRSLDDAGVDLVDNTPFYFQLNAGERLNTSYHDLLKSMKKGKIPVVVHKRNNKGTIIAMKLEDFANLLLFKE
jgi:hypothetical protein